MAKPQALKITVLERVNPEIGSYVEIQCDDSEAISYLKRLLPQEKLSSANSKGRLYYVFMSSQDVVNALFGSGFIVEIEKPALV